MPELLAVFIVYLAGLLVLGELAARRGVPTLEDFLLAGRREGPGVLAATVSATVIGAGSTLGAAGAAYYVGISAAWYLWSASLGLLILALTFAGPLRRSAAYTVPELLERRYGPRARALAAALGLAGLTLFLAAQFYALGTVLRSLTDLHAGAGILIGSAVTIAYTARGGIRAVHWTDALQLGWIVVGIAATAVASLAAAGGLDGFATPPPVPTPRGDTAYAWFDPYTGAAASPWNPVALGSTVLGWVVMSTTWHFTMQSTAQRLLAARDPGTAARACVLSSLLLLPLAALIALAGMGARILLPALPPTGDFAQSDALPALVRVVLPPLLGAIVLAALVAAIMSTADSVLLGASTSALLDGVRRFVRPSLTDAQVVRGVRRATLWIGALATGLALVAGSLIRLLELVAGIYAAAVFAPLILGLAWRGANETGAVWGMTASAVAAVGWRASGLEGETGLHMLLLSLPVGFVTTWAGSILGSARAGPGHPTATPHG